MANSTQQHPVIDDWDIYQRQALEEYNRKYKANRVLYDIEDAPDGIEISQSGGVYEHNIGGVNYIGQVVTPFDDTGF